MSGITESDISHVAMIMEMMLMMIIWMDGS